MTSINWTKIQEEHKGKWFALKDDEKTVIASAITAKEAVEKARKKGYEMPILVHMPKKITAYIGAYEISI